MPHGDIYIPEEVVDKPTFYANLLESLQPLLEDQAHSNWISNLSNASALMYHHFMAFGGDRAFGRTEEGDPIVNWCGFYIHARFFPLLSGSPDLLLLGPFAGRPACQQINPQAGKGVCADAFVQSSPMIVKDVDAYPGHIACDGETKSEIVLPLIDSKGRTVGVLDLDSVRLGTFGDEDRVGLEQVGKLLGSSCDFGN
ncbi:E [Phaffia rhodozyma]|uniref:E n=1 Tax=Phaffia rhodozyma TaxID=264483 RepID=A0A0F7SPE3_PHARH|nr:E [Phaffia rhodozyma] [Phaffia rhodozyma]